jgi:hypothetical protein
MGSTIFVLLMVFADPRGAAQSTVLQQEFNSRTACIRAGTAMTTAHDTRRVVVAAWGCFPLGEERPKQSAPARKAPS